jgi:imidazolonepropionase-like amidohydrolase
MTLVVSGGRITTLGKATDTSLPQTAHVVDASGKFVIPGLWDMHVHTLQSMSSGGESFDVYEAFFPLFVANGVTGVRDMNGDLDLLARAQQKMSRGEILGPRVVAAGPIVDGVSWPFGSIAVSSADEGQHAVRVLKGRGADFVKVGSLVPRDAYFSIVAETKSHKIPFVGHVPFAVTATEASDAGQRSIEHLDGVLLSSSPREGTLREEMQRTMKTGDFSVLWRSRVRAEAKALETYDDRFAAQLTSRFIKNGTWQIPTLVLKQATSFFQDKRSTDDPRLAYIPGYLLATWGADNGLTGSYDAQDFANDRRVFAKLLQVVGMMHHAGVKFMPGTDSIDPYIFPGFSVHDELALFVQAGLTPMQALQAATWNPAEYLGITDTAGSVAIGKVADLVLLDANPLEDIRNTQRIWAVVLHGKLLQKAALEALLASRKAAAKQGGA